jgi:hypothetical protein
MAERICNLAWAMASCSRRSRLPLRSKRQLEWRYAVWMCVRMGGRAAATRSVREDATRASTRRRTGGGIWCTPRAAVKVRDLAATD